MRRVEVFAWVCDQAIDGGRRHFGGLFPISGDWWTLLCKDASIASDN